MCQRSGSQSTTSYRYSISFARDQHTGSTVRHQRREKRSKRETPSSAADSQSTDEAHREEALGNKHATGEQHGCRGRM